MKTKSTARIQFELACMRHAYRHRPYDLNRPRRRSGQIIPIPPLLFAATYGTGALISIAIIITFILKTR